MSINPAPCDKRCPKCRAACRIYHQGKVYSFSQHQCSSCNCKWAYGSHGEELIVLGPADAIDVTVPGRALHARFLSLGNMAGRTAAEIIAVVGQPSSVSSMALGQTLMQWQETGCHMALLFAADGRLVNVTHQSTTFGGQTLPVGTSGTPPKPQATSPALSPTAAKPLTSAADVTAISSCGAELKRLATDLDAPIKPLLQNATLQIEGCVHTLQELLQLDLFYLFTLFKCASSGLCFEDTSRQPRQRVVSEQP